MATTAAVDHDIGLLVGEIRRLGEAQADGSVTTTFGALFADDKVQNTLESLAGTLKAAKRKKIIKVSTPQPLTRLHCRSRSIAIELLSTSHTSTLISLSLCLRTPKYQAELLLQGVSDKEVITLLPQPS